MRAEWVARRKGEKNISQMHYARKGVITEEMAHVAKREALNPLFVRDEVARGRMIIPANIAHPELEPMCIGINSKCKINANIGNSAVTSHIDDELVKLQASIKYGADTVMDLSTGGNIPAIRDAILRHSNIPVGTVPIYEALARVRKVEDLTAELMLQVIEEQADRLNRYVSDLLDLSRMNAGSMPVRLELNAVDDLLSATIEETEAALGRPLDVRLPSDGVLLAGRFDLSLSVRILVNLVENANKYGPQGSPIRIDAVQQGGVLRLTVADRGPGIDAAEVDRVFTPFYRPLSAPADRGSAGLGLALCQRMAELQKGRLSYAPNPAGGSLFVLELPAVELPAAAYEPQSL